MGHCSRLYKMQCTDLQIGQFYIDLIKAGRDRAAFYPGPRARPDEFVNKIRTDKAEFWLLLWDGKVSGYIQLRDFEGKSAMVDFAFLPLPVMRHPELRIPASVALGRYAVASLLYDKFVDGTFIMDTLIGKTPAWNVPAVKLIQRVGGTIIGLIPDCCECFDSHTMSAGVVTYFNRQNISGEYLKY